MAGRPKIKKIDALNRASENLWDLIVYFNVTRPRYDCMFKRNGKFSPRQLMNVYENVKSLSSKRPSELTSKELQYLNIASSKLNGTFGIPHDLVEKVLGTYRENGVRRRISLKDVLPIMKERGHEVQIVPDGRKCHFYNDADGRKRSEVLYSYHSKMKIADREKWVDMLSDPKYERIENYASRCVQTILFKWNSELNIRLEEKRKSKIRQSRGQIKQVTRELVDELRKARVDYLNGRISKDAVECVLSKVPMILLRDSIREKIFKNIETTRRQ